MKNNFIKKLLRFFTFREMLAPRLIRFLYWIGSIVIVSACFAQTIGALFPSGAGVQQALITLLGGIALLFIWRIFTELWIVIFSIHERLGEIRDALGNASAPAADTTHSPD